jgi:hypothetical protein
MKRLILAILVMAWLPSVATADWKKEPNGFRGVPWTGTAEDFRRALPALACRGKGLKSTACYVDDLVIGDAHVKLTLDFLFSTNRLWILAMEIRRQDYSFIKKLFVEKYGDPTNHVTQAGVTTLEWRGKQVTIQLDPGDQFSGPGASFEAVGSSKKLTAENRAERQREEAAKNSARKSAKNAF